METVRKGTRGGRHNLHISASCLCSGYHQGHSGTDRSHEAIANMRVIDAVYRQAGLHPRAWAEAVCYF